MPNITTSLRLPNKQRIAASFRGERPDRVPNFEVLVENPTFSAVMGRPMADHTLANIDPHDYLEFVTHIGQDVIGMCFYSSPFRVADETGALRPLDFPITCAADLARVVTLDLTHLGAQFALLDRYADAVRGTDVGLFVLTGSFLCDAYTTIFGFENFMCLLYDERELIEEVLERYTEYYVAIAERLVQYDLTFFYVGDDVAYKSGTIVSPDLLRELWAPRIQRIMAPAAARGLPILFHSDGNISELIPDLLAMGVSALNPIEPYGMDIREIKRRYGRNLTLVGNLDVGGHLSCGTPAQVRAEAAELIDAVGRDGGLVLASCHSITANVRPENFRAMVETAQTYGALGAG